MGKTSWTTTTKPVKKRTAALLTVNERTKISNKEWQYFKRRCDRVKYLDFLEQWMSWKRKVLFNTNKYSSSKCEEIARKDFIRIFQRDLIRREELYIVGREQQDELFKGAPDDWSYEAVEAAKEILLQKKKRKGWTVIDDLQWVYKRFHVNTVKLDDFPTMESFNMFVRSREDPKWFEDWFWKFATPEAIKQIKEDAKAEALKEGQAKEEESNVPYEETGEYKAFQEFMGIFKKEAKEEVSGSGHISTADSGDCPVE